MGISRRIIKFDCTMGGLLGYFGAICRALWESSGTFWVTLLTYGGMYVVIEWYLWMRWRSCLVLPAFSNRTAPDGMA